MVVFHIKNGQADGFLYEASVQDTNEDLIAGLVGVWNMRIRLTMLVGAVRELAKFGPMKPQEEHGIDSIKEEYEGAAIERSADYAADPSGTRTGNGPGPQLAETLERVCVDAEDALSPELVKRRLAVSMAALEDKLANLKVELPHTRTHAFDLGLTTLNPPPYSVSGLRLCKPRFGSASNFLTGYRCVLVGGKRLVYFSVDMCVCAFVSFSVCACFVRVQ
mmetsp:Transcript_25712/g.43842  ORF Transcript_25712/g.43842 Transcript_25712/m.43842 type:complete len:220 (-) Transcript_25712:12-671(-)